MPLETGKIKLVREGPMAVLTLDNPPVNALRTDMLLEIGERVAALEKEGALVLVVTGAGNNAFCAGGGLELALACDLRIAATNARFSAPEVNLGMIPGYGGTQRLPKTVGKAKAKELILTAKTIRADEALRLGLVNQVVPDGEELRAAKDVAMQIASKAPLAVRAAKKAINEGWEKHYMNGFVAETRYFQGVLQSEDLKEGIRAFLEKRQAKWQGK